jgi:hypothetical protein
LQEALLFLSNLGGRIDLMEAFVPLMGSFLMLPKGLNISEMFFIVWVSMTVLLCVSVEPTLWDVVTWLGVVLMDLGLTPL